MTNRRLRNRCVTGLVVIALIAGCLQLKTYWWQPVTTVQAQGDDDDDGLSGGALAVLLLAVGGASPAQKVRFSVGTMPTARKIPYAWFYTVHNTRNEVLFRSERIEVPSGEWRFSEVSSEAFRTEEPQVMVQVVVDLSRGGNPADFIGAAQVLDPVTGESSTDLKLTFRPAQ